MGKYGLAAVEAVSLIMDKPDCTPLKGWNQSTSEIYGENTNSQRKGCPKNAFLGLCEAGLITGISKGNYAYKSHSLNKMYALEAVRLLRKNSVLANDKNRLWKEVMKGQGKSHNSQMDVVLALWNKGLIVQEERQE
ncbi:hypothetical protein C173_03174 [Paenibacillus sp. FSL R7-277]|uniref:DUF6979 family protein n=1 Tax=Paenibacillus sp. FSL R7-277 TaxID=1227352 RepID=UPI0003E23303|nr:hypothetical protein [Paenibacillus sp. FSL R7-277]ETT77484.1 hypothetical protein C173_03174 [Paenibacillus sp. FSL R7-277]